MRGGDKVAPALPTTLSSLHYCLVVASLFNIVFHIWTIIVILPNKHRLHKQRYTNLQPPSLPPYASPFHILVVHLIQLCILHVGFKLVLTSVTERFHQSIYLSCAIAESDLRLALILHHFDNLKLLGYNQGIETHF